MSRLGVRQFLKYAARYAEVRSYFRSPGDGRVRPQIPAAMLLRALLAARLLREVSFLGVEELVKSPARRVMGVRLPFGDDALAYLTERLNVDRLLVTRRCGGTLPRWPFWTALLACPSDRP